MEHFVFLIFLDSESNDGNDLYRSWTWIAKTTYVFGTFVVSASIKPTLIQVTDEDRNIPKWDLDISCRFETIVKKGRWMIKYRNNFEHSP